MSNPYATTRLCALIGYRGVGKTTILRHILRHPGTEVLMTWTDRPRREGEGDIETRFIERMDFDHLIDTREHDLLQLTHYRGNRYCTVIQDAMVPDVVFFRPILWHGVLGLEGSGMFDITAIAITAPSIDSFMERNSGRTDGSITNADVNRCTLPPPCPRGRRYDCVFQNDDAEAVAERIVDMVMPPEEKDGG